MEMKRRLSVLIKFTGLIGLILASPVLSSETATQHAQQEGTSENLPVSSVTPVTPKKSYYTARILRFLDVWPPPTLSVAGFDKRPVFIRAIHTPDHEEIVGMVKHFVVKVPLNKVVDLTESFDQYPSFWEDIVSVKAEPQSKGQILTSWVRKAPAFFLSKLQYRILYTVNKNIPGRVVFHQQLLDGDSLLASDSLIVLESLSNDSTRVSIVSFFEVNAGAFGPLIKGKIWRKTQENSFKDDVAFKAKLENPNWSLDQITKAAEDALDQYPFEEVESTDLLHFDLHP